MALGETADLAVRLTLDDKFSRGLRGATGALGKFQSSIGRVGRGTSQVVGGLTRVGAIAGTVAAGGLIGAAKAAIDFEDAFAGVRKTVDESQLAAAGLTFDDLARSFRDMATEIPIAATELAAIGETAGALGIKAQDIDDFSKTVALLGVTTDLTSDAAAESLGKVGTILGLTGGQFEDFADVLVNLGNQGASTESEIIEVTKRFAAMGRQAGLTTEEILALSSAATSLGAEPEAAGSALQRIFANMSTEIANGTDKGKEFAKITGDSLDTLRKKINRGDALPILLDTLQGLQGLSRTKGASVLKALGITNVRDRNAILLMSQNLGFVNDQLTIASQSTGALGKEAQKRFDTVASKIQLFKNNITEAGITVGEGFIGPLGRATEKLSAFLKQDANKAELRAIGEDIGKFIEGINWAEVVKNGKDLVGVLKTGVGFAKSLLDVFMALPTEIKAAAAGMLILNKASGGLLGAGVGNIAGGLAETVIRGVGSRIPKIGGAFAQPVYVTNWPLGGLGGVGGAAAGGRFAGAGKVALGLTGVGLAAVLADEFGDEIIGLGQTMGQAWQDAVGVKVPDLNADQLQWPFGPKNTPTILPELVGGNGILGGTGAGAGARQVGTSVRTNDTQDSRASLQEEKAQKAKLAAIETKIDSSKVSAAQSARNLAANQQRLAAEQKAVTRAGTATVQGATRQVGSSVRAGTSREVGTLFSVAAMIVGAIWASGAANRPVIQPTNVIEKYTTIVRTGSPSGSRNSGPLEY